MKHSSEDTTFINSCRIDTLDVNMAHFRITSILLISIFNYSGTSGMCNLCVQLLAHLSRRLTGELIGYRWSGVRPSSSIVRPFTFSNIFSKTTWPIKAKFNVEPLWVGGTKVCSRHLGHMTKMAATPIYGINPSKIFFSKTGKPIFSKLGM